jgi:hypothetical protein
MENCTSPASAAVAAGAAVVDGGGLDAGRGQEALGHQVHGAARARGGVV